VVSCHAVEQREARFIERQSAASRLGSGSFAVHDCQLAHSPTKEDIMNPTNEAATGGSEQIPVTIVTADGDGKLSVAQAARALASVRHKPRDQEQAYELRQGSASTIATATLPGPESAAPRPVQESSAAAYAASEDAGEHDLRVRADEALPGETESVDPGAELPSIEPPRSWTKADKELFTSLPR